MAPGGEWRGAEYWTPSPLRAGSDSTDSFHIFEFSGGWVYKDFVDGTSGDFTNLLAQVRGITDKEAAQAILGESTEVKPKAARKPKAASVPAPADCNPVHPRITEKPSLVTKYRNADKTVAFAIIRWDAGILGEKKEIRPIYWTGSAWIDGLPEENKKSRPLLGLPRFINTKPAPVLIVEGEAKATAASAAIKSRIVTTWHGGADNAQYTDAAPLESYTDIVMWPDADEPGRAAAFAIAAKLPQVEILDVWSQGKADGWDVADAITEGLDPEAFIADCPRLAAPPALLAADPDPFRCIGYDAVNYWFLLGGQRQPYTIPKGSFNGSKLGELAPPAWWGEHDALSESGCIDITAGQQIIIERQNHAGIFDPGILRGSGVWLDKKEIVINDGKQIVRPDSSTTDLAAYDGEAVYVRSSVHFGDMTGDESNADEGRGLLDLFAAQHWSRSVDGIAALGWALIAPFGGLLKFRPHIWVSGRKGTGKTFVLENLIAEICGPFAHLGSGKDTEPGIRRTLNMDARPVILDEMEPKGKAKENVQKILDLERNASSDGSGRITMADGKGTVNFLIRSCFCNASINNVINEGAAIASRIIQAELVAPKTQSEERAKIKRSKTLYAEVMKDAGRYRRRIFRALPRILDDVEKLRDILPASLGGARDADLWAPILAAAWAVQSDESITCDEGQDWLDRVLDEEQATRQTSLEDEDMVIEHILSAVVINDNNERRTVAELLALARSGDYSGDAAGRLLERQGIRILDSGGRRVLAIATRADAISRLLRDTPYEAGYDAQIKRHPLCLTPDKAVRVRMGEMQTYARYLDWVDFRTTYMEGVGA